MIKVEISRTRSGHKEEESADFEAIEAARQWADVMREHYGYSKAWINGVEYNGKKPD